jgi:flagellin-specific chaperone FliS
MLASRSPQDVYRRVDFDARVSASGPNELVHICIEHLVAAIGTALHAAATSDNGLKSRSLTRALSAITALQLGVTGEDGMAMALRQVYEAARRTILDCAIAFDAERLAALRTDFTEIGAALRGA